MIRIRVSANGVQKINIGDKYLTVKLAERDFVSLLLRSNKRGGRSKLTYKKVGASFGLTKDVFCTILDVETIPANERVWTNVSLGFYAPEEIVIQGEWMVRENG